MQRFRLWSCLVGLLLFAHLDSSPTVRGANLIQAENAKAGTTDWQLTKPGFASGVIEGYASDTSVNIGGSIRLFVKTTEPSYQIDIFRMGYYGGLGGRRMLPTIAQPGIAQPACPIDSTTGAVECNWIGPYTLSVPVDWLSGIYLAKLTSGTTHTQQYIQFAVRDERRFSDILMIQGVNTYQAYNVWGGKSLYGTIAQRSDTAHKAVKVSFNRPYYGDETNGAADFLSSVQQWERNMLFFLEKEGYDVAYATDVDTDENADLLLNHKVVEVVGHSEYWTWAMFDHFERARDSGVNLFFASGNTAYWQVRYEPSTVDGTARRVMVGYKELLAQDPQRGTQYATTEFRYSPVNRSEDQMLGVRFVTQAKPPFCVEDASSWIFTNTGLRNGDCVLNPNGSPFLGYEVDTMGPFSPASVQRVAHSPATPRYAHFSDMTVYRAASGATVVDTGSIGWSETVPSMQQITRNILSRMITGAFIDTVPVRPSISPFTPADVGDVGRAGFVALGDATSFSLNGAGSNGPFDGQDALFFAYQQLNGDGQMVVRLKSCQNFWDNRCGIAVRESLTPGARSVSVLGTPSESTGSINEGAEFRVKNTIGGRQTKVAGADLKQPNWLKLVRTGDAFSGQLSADGATWTTIGTASVPMNRSVSIGAVVQGAQHGVWVTGVFDHAAVESGGTPVDPGGPLDRSDWMATASESSYNDNPSKALDGDLATRYTSGKAQHPGQTFTVSWPGNRTVSRIRIEVGSSTGDFPRGCTIALFDQAGTSTAESCSVDAAGNVDVSFAAVSVNKIVVTQTGTAASWWSIAELNAYGSATGPPPAPTASLTATPASISSGASSTLSWSTTNATTVSIDHGIGSVAASGSANTTPAATTTYTLTATGSGGSATATATVTVGPAGGACAAVTLSKTGFYSGAAASKWTVTVTAPSTTCTWQPVPDASWIVVASTSPTPGQGNGSFVLKTTLNTTGAFRTGHLAIAGATYIVKQEP
jgi:hypothetical protein